MPDRFIQPLIEGVVAVLSNDATLIGQVQGVYRIIPRRQIAYPYVVVSTTQAEAGNVVTNDSAVVSIRIRVVSAQQEHTELESITSQIAALLHHQVIALSDGYCLIALHHEGTRIEQSIEGALMQSESRYRAVVATETE